jgi:hypothetical protein
MFLFHAFILILLNLHKLVFNKHHFETDKNGVHSPPGSKSILADNWPHPDKQKLVYLNSKDWLIDWFIGIWHEL